MKKKIDAVEMLLNEFNGRVSDDREKLFEDEKNKLESEFVSSLNNSQKQKYNRLCDEFYRCGMFHDRVLIEFVLSFVGSILTAGTKIFILFPFLFIFLDFS